MQLDAARTVKAEKFPSNIEKSKEEKKTESKEQEKGVEQQQQQELLCKLQKAKQEVRNIHVGNFVPLVYVALSATRR